MAVAFVGISNDVDGWNLVRGSSYVTENKDGSATGTRTYRGPAAGLADFLATVPIDGSDPEGEWSGFKIATRTRTYDGPWCEVQVEFEGASDSGSGGVENIITVVKKTHRGAVTLEQLAGNVLFVPMTFDFEAAAYFVEWSSEAEKHTASKGGTSGIENGVVRLLAPKPDGSTTLATPVKDTDFEVVTLGKLVSSKKQGDYWRNVEVHWKEPIPIGYTVTDEVT